jgi:hypothetical protein
MLELSTGYPQVIHRVFHRVFHRSEAQKKVYFRIDTELSTEKG